MTSRRRLAGFLMVAVLGLAACDQGVSTTAPGSTGSTAAPSAASTTNGPSVAASGGGAQAGQTDTDWGRIWDTLPAGFPPVAGSTPSDEAAAGPASANLVVEGNAAKAIATSMQAALEGAGFRTAGLSGPLEDGGYVLDMTGPAAGCKIQVRVAPTGGLTTVTILYGAACPFS